MQQTNGDEVHTKILYQYGRIFICFGIFINLIILVDGYKEAIRFAGFTCIFGGTLLTLTALYGTWLRRRINQVQTSITPISMNTSSISDNPPEYDIAVRSLLPNYSEAVNMTELTFALTSNETTQIVIENEILPHTTRCTDKCLKLSEDINIDVHK